MSKWCSNCNAYKESWADHPSYNSSDTYRRAERCWSCDKWTLAGSGDVTISGQGGTLTMTREQRMNQARELSQMVDASGGRHEYEAKIEVNNSDGSSLKYGIVCRKR